MSAFQAAAAKVPASATLNLRRPLLVSLVVGAAGLLVCGLFGHIVMGILIVIGLGLGVLNTRLLQHSVVKVISSENPSKKAIGRSALPRLLFIAGLAVAFGIFLKPDGFGVFFGLAAFQVIIIATTVTPVMKRQFAHSGDEGRPSVSERKRPRAGGLSEESELKTQERGK